MPVGGARAGGLPFRAGRAILKATGRDGSLARCEAAFWPHQPTEEHHTVESHSIFRDLWPWRATCASRHAGYSLSLAATWADSSRGGLRPSTMPARKNRTMFTMAMIATSWNMPLTR